MLLYTLISCLRIHRKVREAVPTEKGIYRCDRIETPFIFGLFRPKIYLPVHLDTADAEYVIAHEKAHLKRLDHWWKPLGFLLLTVYWFHPLLWIAYLLLCRDIELACDERVLKELGTGIKKDYSNALINCSASRKTVAACPLAFGEVGVKQRVKSVLSYKKPTLWILIAAVVLSSALAVAFLTDPKRDLTEEVTPSTTLSDVSIDVLSVELGESVSEIIIRLKNDHEDELIYTDRFRLLRWQDDEWQDWQLNGIYEFNGAEHILESGRDVVLSFRWATADTSMEGKYRIEFDYELYDDMDQRTDTLIGRFHHGILEFETEEDLGIPNWTNFMIVQNTRGGLWLNRVNLRFALTYNGKILEEGNYTTEEIPGLVILRTDTGKQYFLVQSFNDHLQLLHTHSDPIPKELKRTYSSVSFRDPKNGRLFAPSNWQAGKYRIDNPNGWGAELWLTNMIHGGSGVFFLWDKPLNKGEIETLIEGLYETDWESGLVICTAKGGNIYRFGISEIKNKENAGNDGYFPVRHPIFLDATAPAPFSAGDEMVLFYN